MKNKLFEKLIRQKPENSKGSIVILLVVMIIAASFFFVNGIFNDVTNRPSNYNTTYTLITPPAGNPHNNLQLNTLKFEACGSSAVIGFLVDQSISMAFSGGVKETNLINALNRFTRNFPDEGIIGLRTYSDGTYTPIVVPFDYFKNNKSQIAGAISSMVPWGGTHSRTAFEDMKRDLDIAKSKFPNYNFNLIFVSDGIPESLKALKDFCLNGYALSNKTYCRPHPDPTRPNDCRCFAPDQDPTQVASEIKASGVKIFSIVYLDDLDAVFRNQLETLMKNVASPPDPSDPKKIYYFEAPFDAQLDQILDGIKTQICTTN